MRIILYSLLSLLLLSCSEKKNEQAEAYTHYMASSAGANAASYTCKSAEFIRTATYKDSMDILVKKLGLKEVKSDTLAPYLFKFSDGFKKAGASYDSLSKVALSKMVTGGMDAMAKSTEYANQSAKNYKEALTWLRTAKLAEQYQAHINETVGQIYVAHGNVANGAERVDTVLFSPDKRTVLRKLSKD